MAKFLRFDENDRHVETTILDQKPKEGKWEEAPADFNDELKYFLNSEKKVEALGPKALEEDRLAGMKAAKLLEVKDLADLLRGEIFPVSQGKNEEYRMKAEAARRILELKNSGGEITADNPDYLRLKFEADAWGMTPEELAVWIQEKSTQSLLAMGVIAAFEVKGKKLVEQSTKTTDLEKALDRLEKNTRKELGSYTK